MEVQSSVVSLRVRFCITLRVRVRVRVSERDEVIVDENRIER